LIHLVIWSPDVRLHAMSLDGRVSFLSLAGFN